MPEQEEEEDCEPVRCPICGALGCYGECDKENFDFDADLYKWLCG